MLIEHCAYSNRWRAITPAAKSLFALAICVAAFVAPPLGAGCFALVAILATTLGAKISLLRFLRVALPPLGFLALGCLSLAYSLDMQEGRLLFQWLPEGWAPIIRLASRSFGALCALLFLALTTPMIDFIAFLRRLRLPEVLLEIMVLCYRMLFVFSESLHDIRTAQAARLGYSTPSLTLKSLGSLTANLTLQIWQRAHALHVAAMSRNNDGAFRFLEPHYINEKRDLRIAFFSALLIISTAAGFR